MLNEKAKRPFDSDDAREARRKILAQWREIERLEASIAKLARVVSEETVDAFERRREDLERDVSDLLLDYYCATERASGRDPYGANENEAA